MNEPLRLLTFNVRFDDDRTRPWSARRDEAARVLAGAGADVVALQEAQPGQLADLAGALPRHALMVGARYGGRLRAAVPLLADTRRFEVGRSGSFAVAPDPSGPPRRAWDAIMSRVCTWAVLRDRTTDGRFAIFNTHLDSAGARARLEGARVVAAQAAVLAPGLPHLIAGDLNEPDGGPALEALRAAGYRDAYATAHPGDRRPTFHGFRGLERPGRIDHVLVDGRWLVLDARIVDAPVASDHHAVLAELVAQPQ